MLPTIIIISSIILIFSVILVIISNSKKAERMKYHIAAGNILREEYLNYSLCNNTSTNDDKKFQGIKLMLGIKTKCGKKKHQFVFNPENKVFIGRDKHNNNIYINDTSVSKKHCCIYCKNNQVYLEDLNSANGTIIERSLFKKYIVHSNHKIILKSNDRIVIGANSFTVVLFYYDMTAV